MAVLDRLRDRLNRLSFRPRNILDEHTSYASWRDYAISRLIRFALLSTFFILVMNFGFWQLHPLVDRIVFWMASIAACLVVYEVMRHIVLNYVNPRWFGVDDIYPITHIYLPLIVIPGALPAALAMHFLYERLLAVPGVTTQPIIFSYVQIMVVGITAGIVGNYLRLFFGIAGIREYGAGSDEAPAAGKSPPPKFMRRVAPEKRGELIALQSEDHYLRVHTENGNDLIRYRLTDAVAELPATAGRQVHRSWWVASAAVLDGRHEGRRAVLRTKSGLNVPVSRSYLGDIRDTGWF